MNISSIAHITLHYVVFHHGHITEFVYAHIYDSFHGHITVFVTLYKYICFQVAVCPMPQYCSSHVRHVRSTFSYIGQITVHFMLTLQFLSCFSSAILPPLNYCSFLVPLLFLSRRLLTQLGIIGFAYTFYVYDCNRPLAPILLKIKTVQSDV